MDSPTHTRTPTYFRYKPNRLASIFLPPVALSIAPDLPSPDLRHTTPPAASSSSKRPQEDLNGGDPELRKSDILRAQD